MDLYADLYNRSIQKASTHNRTKDTTTDFMVQRQQDAVLTQEGRDTGDR